MEIRRNFCAPALTLGCLCLMVQSLSAAQFHVTTGRSTPGAGARFTIPIEATAEVTVGAAQLELIYDPLRLQWIEGAAGPLTANTLVDAHLLTPGRVRIAFAGGEEVRSTGTIYIATFEWRGVDSGSTPIHFEAIRAWDQTTGLELTCSTTLGEAIPNTQPANSRIFVGLGISGVVLLAILAVIRIARRKSAAVTKA